MSSHNEEQSLPQYYSSVFLLTFTPQDFRIVCGSPRTPSDISPKDSVELKIVPSHEIVMSPNAAKELLTTFTRTLAQYEEKFGEITTKQSKEL